MQVLFEKYFKKLQSTPLKFQRYLLPRIDGKNRLIGIKGARGAGKTTLLLQYILINKLPKDYRTLYVSLDDLYFSENKLYFLVDRFVKEGGEFLFLDEVHRYPGDWSAELKNIYDDFEELQVVFTGSSLLHLDKAKGDLSRRAVMYELWGLSFREYLNFVLDENFQVIKFHNVLEDHQAKSLDIINHKVRPLLHFNDYLNFGYYPYFLENRDAYPQKLAETIELALGTDLPAISDLSYASIEKIRLLLYILAESVPFKPNISKLSERTGVTRGTLINFLKYLEDLRIIHRLFASTKGIGLLQKPDKIYLHHPNLYSAMAYGNSNKGSIRESFFINQLAAIGPITYSKTGDFKVNEIIFEIGGKNKTSRQIKSENKAFVVMDDIEIGHIHKIPLWLFGFLY